MATARPLVALRTASLAALAGLAWACAPTLETPDDDVPEGPVIHLDVGDGSTITQIDGSDRELWRYFDLESMAEARPADETASEDWDLGFRRDKIKINGGVSGPGGMGVAVLLDTEFDDVTRAPADGYHTDDPDSDIDENEDPDYVFSVVEGGWYDYDFMTHVLTPTAGRVYVVRSVEMGYYKLVILDYYEMASRSAAFVNFRWAPIDPPDGAAR